MSYIQYKKGIIRKFSPTSNFITLVDTHKLKMPKGYIGTFFIGFSKYGNMRTEDIYFENEVIPPNVPIFIEKKEGNTDLTIELTITSKDPSICSDYENNRYRYRNFLHGALNGISQNNNFVYMVASTNGYAYLNKGIKLSKGRCYIPRLISIDSSVIQEDGYYIIGHKEETEDPLEINFYDKPNPSTGNLDPSIGISINTLLQNIKFYNCTINLYGAYPALMCYNCIFENCQINSYATEAFDPSMYIASKEDRDEYWYSTNLGIMHLHGTCEIKNCEINYSKNTTKQAAIFTYLDSSVLIENTTINSDGPGICQPAVYEGGNISLIASNITSNYGPCIMFHNQYHSSEYKSKLGNLIINGGTYHSKLYSTIEVSDADIHIEGTTIICDDSIQSTSLEDNTYALTKGYPIALLPNIPYQYIIPFGHYNTDTNFYGSIDFSGNEYIKGEDIDGFNIVSYSNSEFNSIQ